MACSRSHVWLVGIWNSDLFCHLLLSPFFCFLLLLFIYLAVLQGTWDLSSLTRDWTGAPCSRSAESIPLDHQGSPSTSPFQYLAQPLHAAAWLWQQERENGRADFPLWLYENHPLFQHQPSHILWWKWKACMTKYRCRVSYKYLSILGSGKWNWL